MRWLTRASDKTGQLQVASPMMAGIKRRGKGRRRRCVQLIMLTVINLKLSDARPSTSSSSSPTASQSLSLLSYCRDRPSPLLPSCCCRAFHCHCRCAILAVAIVAAPPSCRPLPLLLRHPLPLLPLRFHHCRCRHYCRTAVQLGGAQKLLFFQSRVTKNTKLQSSTSFTTFPAQKSTFLQLPPPSKLPNLQCTLPLTLACFIPPLREGINNSANVAACRLPRGVPLRQPIFYLALLATQHCANRTSTMMFFRFVEPNRPPLPSIL